MKLSARTRYGIAALTYLHLTDNEVTTLLSIAEHLNVSKIYLEQVFANLRASNIVEAVKGPAGGYFLSKKEHNMYDVLMSLEPSLFEKTQPSTDDTLINQALCDSLYTPIDDALKCELKKIKLSDIAEEIKHVSSDNSMYYI